MLVSGSRATEVSYLSEQVGISKVHAEKVQKKSWPWCALKHSRPKPYVGDGINDAPAMMAGTVSIAIG